ncbi:cubilin [Lingula anatina]|uniref:Cubilin n=1 Tax=Lingula anatina TaxID=7574 RepID=A0A1S3HDI7_LINAN|nr:cubilin [Lingula anatina]|eukprot:XP_013383576.1 cubilin [Lingula anatina]
MSYSTGKADTDSYGFYDSTQSCDQEFDSRNVKSGRFYSPNIATTSGQNINATECSYTFKAEALMWVKIEFDILSIGTEINGSCSGGDVTVYSVDDRGTEHLLSELCGRHVRPPTVVSRSPHAVVRYHRNTSLEDPYRQGQYGFIGRYTFWTDGSAEPHRHDRSCGPQLITGSSGTLQSPGYPQPYSPGTLCSWNIEVESSAQILITFLDLDIGNNIHCNETRISIFNHPGRVQDDPEAVVCGKLMLYDQGVREFMSGSNSVHVRFFSVNSKQHTNKGFRFVWTAVQADQTAQCRGFQCAGGQVCLDRRGLACYNLPQYCIHPSLECDAMPNCGAFDLSDENRCEEDKMITLTAVGIAASVLLLVTLLTYKSVKWYRKQTRTQRRKGVNTLAKDVAHQVRLLAESPSRHRRADHMLHGLTIANTMTEELLPARFSTPTMQDDDSAEVVVNEMSLQMDWDVSQSEYSPTAGSSYDSGRTYYLDSTNVPPSLEEYPSYMCPMPAAGTSQYLQAYQVIFSSDLDEDSDRSTVISNPNIRGKSDDVF